MSIFCNYWNGMFACEPPHEYEAFFASTVTAHHEAGHAVAAYVLGLGIGRRGVGIRETYKPAEKTFSSGGVVFSTKAERRRVKALLKRGTYDPILAKVAIASAAGPAAELKHCRQVGAPARTLGASEGDHNMISCIGKNVLDRSPYFRSALERFAWHQAQLLLEQPPVWDAVCYLAGWLDGPEQDETTEYEHSSFAYMPASEARWLIKRILGVSSEREAA